MQWRYWHPTPVLLPGKSHGWRSLEGCSPWGRWGSDTTEWLHFHFSLSRIGEGNGNPLQCSCQENPRDRGAWWAAVHWVTQSRTLLKRLSSSSSIPITIFVQVMNPLHNAQSNGYFCIFILYDSIIWQSWPLHPLSPYVILLLVFFLNSQDPLKLLRFIW